MQKRIKVGLIFLLSLTAFLLVLKLYPQISEREKFLLGPSCLDDIQNGDEEGVDCGGSCPNDCAIPNWKKMKAIWAGGWRDTDAHRLLPIQYGLNTLIPNYGAFQWHEQAWDSITLKSLQEEAITTKKYNTANIPTFKFVRTYDSTAIVAGMQRGKYWNPKTQTMNESALVAPLDAVYWQKITNITKRLVLMPLENSSYRIDGLFIDMELYNAYDENLEYFNYDGSYEDATFNEFLTTQISPPAPPTDWHERRNYLIQAGLLNDYHAFVQQKAVSRAREMMKEIYALNPNFSIGSYPSPQWRTDKNPNRYVYPMLLDFFEGWAYKHVPILYGTETYGCAGPEALESELQKTGKGYFSFTRKDTGKKIFLYYVSGFILGWCDSYYKSPTVSNELFNDAKATNGYWLWDNSFLVSDCYNLPGSTLNPPVDYGYRIRVNCQNEAIVPWPSNCNLGSSPPQFVPYGQLTGNANCCFYPSCLSKNDWETQCCPNFNSAVEDYWSALAQVNALLPDLCDNSVLDANEQCDNSYLSNPLNNQICQSFDFPAGGALSCTAQCQFNTTSCSNLPTRNNFDSKTTNFATAPNIETVSNAILENSTWGMINFTGQTLNFSRLDLDSYVKISGKRIEIDTTGKRMANLNASAVLAFYNVKFSNPELLRGGVECSSSNGCYFVSYANNVYSILVPGFSVYILKEGYLPPSLAVSAPPLPITNASCTPNWQCAQWSDCINNQQTRTCTDVNNCGVITSKPTETKDCEPSPAANIVDQITEGITVGARKINVKVIVSVTVVALLSMVTFILSLILLRRRKTMEKRKAVLRNVIVQMSTQN